MIAIKLLTVTPISRLPTLINDAANSNILLVGGMINKYSSFESLMIQALALTNLFNALPPFQCLSGTCKYNKTNAVADDEHWLLE